MPWGSRIIKKRINKNKGTKTKSPESPQIPTPLKPKIMAQSPAPNKKKNDVLGDALEKFKNFIVSPTGIITTVALIVLVHYAWKGFNAPEGKAKA